MKSMFSLLMMGLLFDAHAHNSLLQEDNAQEITSLLGGGDTCAPRRIDCNGIPSLTFSCDDVADPCASAQSLEEIKKINPEFAAAFGV